ncbi:MAG: hypothetical protein KGZ58_05190, partial [Ignavibacteriales bacterium]|nr:hypothetical protein [Ignavibacteriales bacterium]
MKDYIPGGEAEFSVWLENVNTKLPAYTDTLGVSHEDIAALQSAFNDVKAKIAEHRAMSTSLHSLTQAKVNVLASARSFVRKVMNRLKTHDRFTTVIGEDLGIIAPPQGAMLPGALDGVAPSFQLTVLPDLVRNDWVKGDFDGVVGQSRRNNETTWVSLGRDSKSPY